MSLGGARRMMMAGEPAAAAGGFVPTDVTGCDLWLDFADTTTITHSGGAVSAVAGKSASANGATQATADRKPTTGTRTINGLNVLDFDVDSLTITTPLAISTNVGSHRTVFAVGYKDAGSSAQVFMGSDDTQVFIAFTADSVAGAPYARISSSVSTSTTSVPNGTPSIVHLKQEQPTLSVGVNGGGIGTADSTGNAKTLSRIGEYASGANLNGVLGEIISYNTALGTTDFNSVITYLKAKWGIA